MAYYTFNIGLPATSAWWQQNLARGVITAGFDAETGDRGDKILNLLQEGDWVTACRTATMRRCGGASCACPWIPPTTPSEHLAHHRKHTVRQPA
jgi:hypothetical protein